MHAHVLSIIFIPVASNGENCPTTRDFPYLGRDYAGTVMTTYLMNPQTNQTAQDTPENTRLCNASCVVIQSDSSRLLNGIMSSLSCVLWVAPDLADAKGIQRVAALPLNEIQAASARLPAGTMALINANDTLATVGGIANLDKLNLVRVGLNQPLVTHTRKQATRKRMTTCERM